MERKKFVCEIPHIVTRCFFIACMAAAMLWFLPQDASARLIHSARSQDPGASDSTCSARDRQAITAELEKTGSVKLAAGEDFYWKTLNVKSGWSIDATGATIHCTGVVIDHAWTATNYNSLKNVTIKGGKWVSTSKKGYTASSFHFTHAQNITLQDMDIRCSNYEGHSIELVACKNVTIKNCTVIPKGSPKSDSVEEQIQIDIATGTTFPRIKGTKYANGATCSNIKILNCTVKGGRAVCANYAKNEPQYHKNYHSNITVKNCKLTGVTSEALALFNTVSATVSGNTIISKAPRGRGNYASGLHFYVVGKNSAMSKKGKLVISKNTIKGATRALLVTAVSSASYGNIRVENNKLYCKSGKKDACLIDNRHKKLVYNKNKDYKW